MCVYASLNRKKVEDNSARPIRAAPDDNPFPCAFNGPLARISFREYPSITNSIKALYWLLNGLRTREGRYPDLTRYRPFAVILCFIFRLAKWHLRVLSGYSFE